jgi:hypothetical protein
MIDDSIKTKCLSLTDTFVGLQVQNNWISTGGVDPLPFYLLVSIEMFFFIFFFRTGS